MKPEDLLQRNMFPRELLNKGFTPHKIIGNIYYVGKKAERLTMS